MVNFDYVNRCSKANALAAVREGTPSLRKMFCTWRATVCSLITSAEAISRLLLPFARRRSTSSSRALSPCVWAEAPVSESTAAISGAALGRPENRQNRFDCAQFRATFGLFISRPRPSRPLR